MKTTSYALVVVSSRGAALPAIHVSRAAVLILVAALIISFCATVAEADTGAVFR